MASDIPHHMPILPSMRDGYSIRRVGDPILMTRARILPGENPATGGRPGQESGKAGRKKPAEPPNTFQQLEPDAFAREALRIDGYRDRALRIELGTGEKPVGKEKTAAVQETFRFAERPSGKEGAGRSPQSGSGLLGLVMNRYLASFPGAEGRGFLAYA